MTKLNSAVSVPNPRLWSRCEECDKRQDCLLGKLSRELGACRKGAAKSPHYIDVAEGDILFRRLDGRRSLFVICSGAIKTQRVTPEGDLIVTGLWLPGDTIGLEVLGDTEYEFDAVATRDSKLVCLNVGLLLEACRQAPEMNIWFTRKLGQLLRRRDIDHASSKGRQSNARILRFFLDLHERTCEGDTDQAIEGELPMHKQDIARYLNMAPETLSRSLSALRRNRLLFISKTHYTVPDVARVRSMAEL